MPLPYVQLIMLFLDDSLLLVPEPFAVSWLANGCLWAH